MPQKTQEARKAEDPSFTLRALRKMLRERGYSEEAVKAILDWYR